VVVSSSALPCHSHSFSSTVFRPHGLAVPPSSCHLCSTWGLVAVEARALLQQAMAVGATESGTLVLVPVSLYQVQWWSHRAPCLAGMAMPRPSRFRLLVSIDSADVTILKVAHHTTSHRKPRTLLVLSGNRWRNLLSHEVESLSILCASQGDGAPSTLLNVMCTNPWPPV
jgi:hypothetical protein